MRRAHGNRLVGAVAALAGVLLLAGCAGASTEKPSASAPSAGPTATRAAPGIGAAAGFQNPDLRVNASNSNRSLTPTHVSIPAVGVESGLEKLGIGADGRIQPPADWQSAGWYSNGVVPGDVGPAVIAGHVDSPTGPAVFLNLTKVTAGDNVIVTMADGASYTYRVDRALRAPKAEFPTSQVYAPTPTPQLRVITCTGTWDRSIRHYTDNLVVFATLASRSAPTK